MLACGKGGCSYDDNNGVHGGGCSSVIVMVCVSGCALVEVEVDFGCVSR